MLLIQKVIKVLDEVHFDIFRTYIKDLSIRSYYPLVLLDSIHRSLDKVYAVDDLCKMVYIDAEEVDEKTRKKFLQLTSYTFKLTSYLSKNYPTYLSTNIPIIHQLMNKGEQHKANLLLQIVLDVAEKIEDYVTATQVLKIIAQQYTLQENIIEATKIHQKINQYLSYQQISNELYLYKQLHFSTKSKAKATADIDGILAYLKQYHRHKSRSIQLLSQYFYLSALNYFKVPRFFEEATFKAITKLEKTFIKNDYLIFPYLEDLGYRITYLKLRNFINRLDNKSVLEASNRILNNSDEILFWNHFVNAPELFSIAVQASHFASHYMTPYRADHLDNIPADVQQRLLKLKAKCNTRIEQGIWEAQSTVKYINLVNIYAGLLLLGTPPEIKMAIRLLEGILYTYQQVPFHAFIDPIFTVIIIGQFSLKQYDEVEVSFRRYKKMTDKKVVRPENDLTIHTFFYAAKWLETQRKQYITKLQTIYNTTKKDYPQNQQMTQQVATYFDIPLTF